MRIRDPEWKKFRSGINIPDPKHCFSWSTLIDLVQLLGRDDRATWTIKNRTFSEWMLVLSLWHRSNGLGSGRKDERPGGTGSRGRRPASIGSNWRIRRRRYGRRARTPYWSFSGGRRTTQRPDICWKGCAERGRRVTTSTRLLKPRPWRIRNFVRPS